MRDRRSTRSRKSDVTTKRRGSFSRARFAHIVRARDQHCANRHARAGPHFCFDLFSVTKPEPVRIYRCVFVHLSRGEDHLSCSSRRFSMPPRSPRESSLSSRSSATDLPRAGHQPGVYFLQRKKLCSTMTDQKSEMSRLLIVNEEAGRTGDQKEIGRR